ncbi:MAG: sucrose-phosphate phosphatase [Jaaginema sp. PMC 1079.18]|nr:sucrose-phosphate phosphatase [Jaaginema sp. PMC 1080.18]MEC4850041.1 sucrose-phosphate phosphatase [Jaaginema sp. PMC 1079.18]MEC4865141.1 sucrose-phosphate phosphatase [Jaaginema sp. PMC 1078.18]
MSQFLFVTDLDNTLVGDRAALAKLNEHLSAQRQNDNIKIVYSTGRSRFLYQQLTEEESLLTPDALICAVGTAIYLNPDEDKTDAAWDEILSQNWDRELIVSLTAHYTDLVPQPDSEQTDYKVSFYLSSEVAQELIPRLKSVLAEKGLKTKIIYSDDKDLDILPENGDKGLALQYLQQKWELAPENTVVCGDSGNDIALFSIESCCGVIVGNAKPELRQWYQENQRDRCYFAQASCAGGILEGLKHFSFLS